MFNGNYKFVKAEIIGDKILTRGMTVKEAADPNTKPGVFIALGNNIDRLVVIGEDVYKLAGGAGIHKIFHIIPPTSDHIIVSWDVIKLPADEGNMIIEMIELKEE